MTGSVVAFTLNLNFLYLDKSTTCSVSDPWIYGMSNKWMNAVKRSLTEESKCDHIASVILITMTFGFFKWGIRCPICMTTTLSQVSTPQLGSWAMHAHHSAICLANSTPPTLQAVCQTTIYMTLAREPLNRRDYSLTDGSGVVPLSVLYQWGAQRTLWPC
jgi:hypothetical protein